MLEALQIATIGLHLVSAHVPGHDGQNNHNFGAYVVTESGLTAGFYENTIKRTSLYVGQTFDVGPLDVGVGVVSGYQRKCDRVVVVTGRQTTVERRDDGSTVTSSGPTFGEKDRCVGASRGALAPMATISYAAPVTFLGLTPRAWLLLPTNKSDLVFHLSADLRF